MEPLEKQPEQNTLLEDVKTTVVCKDTDKNQSATVKLDLCHKSNGVAEIGTGEDNKTQDINTMGAAETCNNAMVLDDEKDISEKSISEIDATVPTKVSNSPAPDVETTVLTADSTVVECEQVSKELPKETEEVLRVITDEIISPEEEQLPEVVTDETGKEEQVIESIVEVDFIEPFIERVTFETEIVVENNGNDLNEKSSEIKLIEDHSSDLLNEIGENIELSEALRASNTTDNMENNNCNVKQEMFNKEELLDILEGNDIEVPESLTTVSKVGRAESQILETQLALQQLSRLKRTKKLKTVIERQSKRRKSDKQTIIPKKEAEHKEEESLVNSLVKDWDEEEPIEGTESEKILEDGKNLLKSSGDQINIQKEDTQEDTTPVRTSVDSSVSDGQSTNLLKSGDETLPQRRLGRIIKKKVIFDPDNPDTFTKGKTITKQKETQVEKDLSLYNKSKSDDILQRSKSKSPLSKLQWKKPPPKNSKQCRRLTEIDKLLMDEGAVNMIYQLTPEAPKGKKNMRTKAEFIKKIQSSTPDTKEMKFRERKKECKSEEGEAKRILGGKHRPSLNNSVKSPSVCEDFEAHSADDSIIYRRHSSSSYSSSCMSPHRLSDVEVSVGNSTSRASLQNLEVQNKNTVENNDLPPEVFMGDHRTDSNEIINKDDCLSIKEKLNSKLSLALNKRKRDSHRIDKPHKQKKLVKTDEKETVSSNNVISFKYLSITIDKKLAELCIKKTGSIYNIEVIKEFEKALLYIDSREDISVTLLMSECGTLCSGLDLKPLLDDNIEAKTSYAIAIAESIRSLLCVLEQHSKLICTGVGANCSGVGLALFALSDVTLASEQASFTLESQVRGNPLLPSIATLVHSRLPQSLLNDLVVFGCRLSASDALRSGLVNRTIWPDCYIEQLRTIAKDIARQPKQNLVLKKQLLHLTKSGSKDLFKSTLEKERNMLVEYWISVEGQKLIHDAYKED